MATGGRVGFSVGSLTAKGILELMQSKFGKDAMKMADEVDRPESALNREMFKEFDERVSRKTLDVPETPKGFKLNKDKLLKNFLIHFCNVTQVTDKKETGTHFSLCNRLTNLAMSTIYLSRGGSIHYI